MINEYIKYTLSQDPIGKSHHDVYVSLCTPDFISNNIKNATEGLSKEEINCLNNTINCLINLVKDKEDRSGDYRSVMEILLNNKSNTPTQPTVIKLDKTNKYVTVGDTPMYSNTELTLYEAKFRDSEPVAFRVKDKRTVHLLSMLVRGEKPYSVKSVESSEYVLDVKCYCIEYVSNSIQETIIIDDSAFKGTLQCLAGNYFELCVLKTYGDCTINEILSWLPDTLKTSIKCGGVVYQMLGAVNTELDKRELASKYVPNNMLDRFMELLPNVPLSEDEIKNMASMFCRGK